MTSSMKQMYPWYRGIHNLSTWAKVFVILGLILVLVRVFRTRSAASKEAFSAGQPQSQTGTPNGALKIIEGPQIYDDFYADIYDSLTYFQKKNEFEMGTIKKSTPFTNESIALDIGSGTGHHVAQLKEIGFSQAMGIEKSQAMVRVAEKKYPKNKYVLGDAMQRSVFRQNTFTHITMFYFTVYYFEDKTALFANCFAWLKPGGTMVIHLADKDMFDPILPPANPLVSLTPQRYAKKRITTSRVTFNNFKYDANFELDGDKATFVEKFTNKDDGKPFRKNNHNMFMDDLDKIESAATGVGFIIKGKNDMIKAEYEYQYLYVFQKPE